MSTTTFYHAVTNGYDKPTPVKAICEHTDYAIFAGCVHKKDAALWNRTFKIKVPPEHSTFSCYMDGNISIKQQVCLMHGWVEEALKDADLAICRHAARRCAYVEIEACVGRKKINDDHANTALDILSAHKLPKNYGLWECGIILRRNNVPWVGELQRSWFDLMVHSGVIRDQIWLPLALHKMNGKIPANRFRTIEMDVRQNHLFTFKPHA